MRNKNPNFLKFIIIGLTFQYSHLLSQEIVPSVLSTHVVKGYAISNTGLMAQSLIPITEIKFIVTKIYKNTVNDIKCFDTIKILEYGAFLNDKYITAGDRECILFRPNAEKIVCLMKYYNYYKIVDQEGGVSIGHICNGKVFSYDSLAKSDNTVINQHYKKLNNLWRNKCRNNLDNKIQKDSVLLEKDTGVSIAQYEKKLNRDINMALECCVMTSDKIAFGSIVEIAKVDAFSIKVKFFVRKFYKGADKQADRLFDIVMPNDGRFKLNINDEGIILFNKNGEIQNSGHCFTKSLNGLLVNNKQKIDDFLAKTASNRKSGDNNE
jgi:hypothetical protein